MNQKSESIESIVTLGVSSKSYLLAAVEMTQSQNLSTEGLKLILEREDAVKGIISLSLQRKCDELQTEKAKLEKTIKQFGLEKSKLESDLNTEKLKNSNLDGDKSMLLERISGLEQEKLVLLVLAFCSSLFAGIGTEKLFAQDGGLDKTGICLVLAGFCFFVVQCLLTFRKKK